MRESFADALTRARRGDREALAEALEVVEARMRRAAHQGLSPALRAMIDTSDVMQTTYVEIVRQIGDFRGEGEEEFVAWLTRILQNNIRDRARYHGRQKRTAPEAPPHQPVIEPDDVSSRDPSPSQVAMNAESLVVLSRALAALDEPQREVIELRMFEHLEYADVAVRMNRTENAVRMLFSRARAALALEIHRHQKHP